MQLFPPQPTHYLPLSILFLLRLADTSATHLSLLALQLLLRPNTTQNYCNAAVSLLLTPLIFLLNLDQISSIIYSHCSSDFWQTQTALLLDWKFWLLLSQGIYLVLWLPYCLKKYKQYREQMFSPL